MHRSSKNTKPSSLAKQESFSLNTKQILNMNTSLLKDFLAKNQKPPQQSHRKYYRKSDPKLTEPFTDTSLNIQNKLQPSKPKQTPRLLDFPHKNSSHYRYPMRYSHKILERTPQKKLSQEENLLSRLSKNHLESTNTSSATSRKTDTKSVQKWSQLSLNQSNISKRKLKNSIAPKNLSSKESSSYMQKQKKYYTSQIKNSVTQFCSDQEFTSAYLTHFMESLSTFKMFSYCYLPKQPHKKYQLPVIAPQKITLVFDLDQTLIHSQVIDWNTEDSYLSWGSTVRIENQQYKYDVNLKIRPFAIEVLKRLKQHFQIGLFTAGQEHYGHKLIQEFDPENKIFDFKIYRPYCLQMNSRVSYVKDLRILGNRDMSKVVLIDNSPQTYLFQKRNAVPIISFLNDEKDSEMLKLQKFLMKLKGVQDVRKVLHETFRLQDYTRFNSMFKLVNQLY